MTDGCSSLNLRSIFGILEISEDGNRCTQVALVESQNPEPVVYSNEVQDAVSAKIYPSLAFLLLPTTVPIVLHYYRDFRDSHDRSNHVQDGVAIVLGVSKSVFFRVCNRHDVVNNVV